MMSRTFAMNLRWIKKLSWWWWFEIRSQISIGGGFSDAGEDGFNLGILNTSSNWVLVEFVILISKAKSIEALKAKCAGLIHKSEVYLHLNDERSHSLKMRQAKLKRQRDRAQARLALEKLEKSIKVYDSLVAIRDYEMLISSNAPYREINWQ
ncbi:hypothetical protein MKW98_011360 [Papaver atlanticum]|uniref:Uncharacterized protein n=1 Tax=Papaver atlanticum TaxID=357466 RepID=A0AAD4SVS6_9MAGN|nr:hypothetical protein MKW98_011360 [Papaver atlanticum]